MSRKLFNMLWRRWRSMSFMSKWKSIRIRKMFIKLFKW